jgi:hypothetical protein
VPTHVFADDASDSDLSEDSMFFFEKKNQKTFGHGASACIWLNAKIQKSW